MNPSISIDVLLTLLLMHWIADFVFQSDKMARGKSTSNWQLTRHCLVYSCLFMAFGWKFALLNAGIHWIVDWYTSRMTKWLWEMGEVHYFFVVVGFDQWIHYVTLLATYVYFFSA